VSSPLPPAVDVFVCEGRVCAANGAGALAAAVVDAVACLPTGGASSPTVHVRRGGCYGLCDLGPNVVVRRRAAKVMVDDADRLDLRGGPDEDVAVAVAAADVNALVQGIVGAGRVPAPLLRATREGILAPRSPVEARLRALRARRGTTKGVLAVVDDDLPGRRGGQGGQGAP